MMMNQRDEIFKVWLEFSEYICVKMGNKEVESTSVAAWRSSDEHVGMLIQRRSEEEGTR